MTVPGGAGRARHAHGVLVAAVVALAAWGVAPVAAADPTTTATPSVDAPPTDYTGFDGWAPYMPPEVLSASADPPTPPPASGSTGGGATAAGGGATRPAPSAAPSAAPPGADATGPIDPGARVLAEVQSREAPSAAGVTGTGAARAAGTAGAPASSDHDDGRSSVSTGLADRIDLSPARVLSNLGLGALITLVLVAASQLFNDALKMHHDRLIRGAVSRSALLGGLGALLGRLPHLPPLLSFGLVAGVLGLLADPSVAFSAATLGQVVGMCVAVGLIVLLYDGSASRTIARRSGLQHSYRLYPVAIGVALGCLALSRVFHIAPGVLYGLFAGVIFTGAVEPGVEARAYARSSVLLVAGAMAAWGVHRAVGPAASEASPDLVVIALDTAAAALFVGGLQAVIVQLLPTRYVNGEKIAAWNRWAWFALLAGSLALYLQFVVRPNPDQQSWSNLWFVGAFVLGAVCFWSWCALRRRVDDDQGPGRRRPGARVGAHAR